MTIANIFQWIFSPYIKNFESSPPSALQELKQFIWRNKQQIACMIYYIIKKLRKHIYMSKFYKYVKAKSLGVIDDEMYRQNFRQK